MIYIGIDPGFSGAVAVILPQGGVELFDCPYLKAAKGRNMNFPLAAGTLIPYLDHKDWPARVCIEQSTAAHGKNGAKLVGTFYAWQMLCAAFARPCEVVAPNKWKRAMGLIKQPKSKSIQVASQLFPEVANQLVGKDVLRQAVTSDGEDPGLVPGRDPASLTARDVLHAVRTYGDRCELPRGKDSEAIYALVDRVETSAMELLTERTLKELAAGASPPSGPATRSDLSPEEASPQA